MSFFQEIFKDCFPVCCCEIADEYTFSRSNAFGSSPDAVSFKPRAVTWSVGVWILVGNVDMIPVERDGSDLIGIGSVEVALKFAKKLLKIFRMYRDTKKVWKVSVVWSHTLNRHFTGKYSKSVARFEFNASKFFMWASINVTGFQFALIIFTLNFSKCFWMG